ncbi:hypothetical protein ACFE04_008525 [Oxalis oulophora]
MLERVLSTRRPTTTSTSTSSHSSSADDESKTKRQHISLLLSNYLSRLSSSSWSLLSLLLLLLVVFLLIVSFRSRGLVCVGPVSRVGFNWVHDGLESDFGYLGVPWCNHILTICARLILLLAKGRSKQGRTVEWTSKDLLKGLEEFVPIYETRPIKNNLYGMGFDHSFGLWFITRWLKPDLMIESGAFKGHSTWVLRQAMPDTPIISITPRHPEKYLIKGPAYVDGNSTYFAGKDFVDFGSIEWRSVMEKHGVTDMSRVIIFFDDHQNELKRIKQALKAGFKHLIFEDNYDTGTGDHYSLRQICDQFYVRGGGHSCFKDSDEARTRERRKNFWEKAVNVDELCGSGEVWWGVKGNMRDNFNHTNTPISHAEHFQNSRFVESILDIYWELPPVAGPSLTHQTRYDPARTQPPIVEDGRYGLFQRLGLGRLDTTVFNGYTQMVYIQISEE